MNLIITKTFFLLSVSFVFSFYTWADKTIDVGANGSSFSTSTTPVSITLGEKIIFNFIGGFHNAESVSSLPVQLVLEVEMLHHLENSITSLL